MNDDRAIEGLEHLQAATLKLIAAARAFLDVAEDLVREPGAAATVVHAAATIGRTVFAGGEPATVRTEPPPEEGRLRHIHVS